MGKLAFDIDFHPSVNLAATGLIDGNLYFYRYSVDNANSDPVRVLGVHAHTKSCRAARFIKGGRALLTGSPDFSILVTDVKIGSTRPQHHIDQLTRQLPSEINGNRNGFPLPWFKPICIRLTEPYMICNNLVPGQMIYNVTLLNHFVNFTTAPTPQRLRIR